MRHSRYNFDGQDEFCLIAEAESGGDAGPLRRILIVLPLFDEMNRMRRVLVSAMRALSEHGVTSFIPDLPGCNESNRKLADQDLESWRRAIATAALQFDATHIASIRGGVLIDDAPAHLPHWRLSGVKGSSLIKAMLRTRIAGDKEAGLSTTSENLIAMGRAGPLELAGSVIGSAMMASIQISEAVPLPSAIEVKLGNGEGEIKGSPLWLRTEPQDDAIMAASIAKNLDLWSASCGG
jgi:hypothetical protein